MKSFIKWSGGKSRSLKIILQNIPSNFNNYYEPFIGGGVVFINIINDNNKKKSYIADTNKFLINAFYHIKRNLKKLLKEYEKYIESYNKSNDKKDFYLKKRDIFNKQNFKKTCEDGALFIFLVNAGFNGQWRMNSKGILNMGWGRKDKLNMLDVELLTNISNTLDNTTIKCEDYTNVIKRIKKNDFIYLDPPYFPTNLQKSNFSNYTKDGWKFEDYLKFIDFIYALEEKGVKIMISNNDVPFLKSIFKNFKIKKIDVFRSVGANTKSNKKIKEVLLTNY
jgi:DNA adenine methylase